MKKRAPIKEIMSTHVQTIQLNESLKNAKYLMDNESIHHLPVMRGESLVGILSDSDFNRLNFGALFGNEAQAEKALLETISIEQLMSFRPYTVEASTPIKEVADIFAEEHFRALPVTESGKVVGIVTVTDLLRFLSEQ